MLQNYILYAKFVACLLPTSLQQTKHNGPLGTLQKRGTSLRILETTEGILLTMIKPQGGVLVVPGELKLSEFLRNVIVQCC